MLDTRFPRVLDSGLNEIRRIRPVSLTIDERLTPLSTASMSLPEDDSAVNVDDWVELYCGDHSEGIYRITSTTESYQSDTSVELDHGLCTLEDDIIPGSGTISGSLRQVLTKMLSYQKCQIRGVNAWALGDVPSISGIKYDYKNNNILYSIVNVLPEGYRILTDQSAIPWTISIIALESEPSCEGRISRNIRNVSITTDRDDLCTRIYCDSLPSPGYIDGPTAQEYGIKAQTFTAQENVTASSLKSYINRYLKDHQHPRVSIEIDADDLSEITGEDADRLEIGRMYRLTIPDRGICLNETILSIRRSRVMDDPLSARITLSSNIKDTAEKLSYIENVVTGSVSSNRASGGYVGSGGSGLAQASVLDMLKVTDTYISENEAWTEEAGVKIDSNTSGIYATKTAIVGGFGGDLEKIDAAITATVKDGGLASIKVSKNGVISAINVSSENVTISAPKIDIDGLLTTINQKGATLSVGSLTAKRASFKEYVTIGESNPATLVVTKIKAVTNAELIPSLTVVTNNEGNPKSVLVDGSRIQLTKTEFNIISW